jgi:alpha-galactosidase
MSYNWNDQKVVDDVAKRSTDFLTVNYSLRDLWAHKNLGNTKKALEFTLPGHDVLMLRLSPVKKKAGLIKQPFSKYREGFCN